MEQNFQTSFIPKKPIVEDRATSSRPAGFLIVVSVFIFFTVLISSGGLYFYKGVLAIGDRLFYCFLEFYLIK